MAVRSASYRPADGTWLADHGWTRRFTNDVVAAYTPISEKPLTFEAASYLDGAAQRRSSQLHQPAALHRGPSRERLRRRALPGRAAQEDRVPVRGAGDDADRHPVRGHDGPPRRAVRGRSRAPAGDFVWGLSAVFSAIGGAGLLAPPLAAWAPNVLFISAAQLPAVDRPDSARNAARGGPFSKSETAS